MTRSGELMANRRALPAFESVGRTVQTPRRQYCALWLLSVLAATCLGVTIFFAFNCSLEYHLSQKLTFEKPERSITFLNIMSHISMFVLAELVSSVFEKIRWALASSQIGTSALTFLVLGRATNLLGVLNLLLSRKLNVSAFWFGDGARIWGGQR